MLFGIVSLWVMDKIDNQPWRVCPLRFFPLSQKDAMRFATFAVPSKIAAHLFPSFSKTISILLSDLADEEKS